MAIITTWWAPSNTPWGLGSRIIWKLKGMKWAVRTSLLLLWWVMTVQWVVRDEDISMYNLSKIDRNKTKFGLYTTLPNGVRSIFEPWYVSISAPETVTETVNFSSPQIYARLFNIGESVDRTDHEKLTSMIKEWLALYFMSSIYGENFLENDYLTELDQQMFSQRIESIHFHASSSPEALVNGFASVAIGKIDPENIDLARIRLEKFKQAFAEACSQLHITFDTAAQTEDVAETQLSEDEQDQLEAIIYNYPGWGEKLLSDYQLHCEQKQLWGPWPKVAIPKGVLEVLDAIIGAKRNVFCTIRFKTEKWHVFLFPMYWAGLILFRPLVRRLWKRILRKDKKKEFDPKRYRIPEPRDDRFMPFRNAPKRTDRATKERIVSRRLRYVASLELLMRGIIDADIKVLSDSKSKKIDLIWLDPMHHVNLRDTFDYEIYIGGLTLSEDIRNRIIADHAEYRWLNVLLVILSYLKNIKKKLPSNEILLKRIHEYYTRYEEIEPFGIDETLSQNTVKQVTWVTSWDIHVILSAVPVITEATTESTDTEIETSEERTASVLPARKRKKKPWNWSVYWGSAKELAEDGKKRTKGKVSGTTGIAGGAWRQKWQGQHDEQYNQFGPANKWAWRKKYWQWWRMEWKWPTHSQRRSSKNRRHTPLPSTKK